MNDISDFASVGQQIFDLGMSLKKLKAERDEIDSKMKTLELELMPLIAKQTAMLSEISGIAQQVMQPVQPAGVPTQIPAQVAQPAGPLTQNEQLKNRIRDFIKRCEDTVSAVDIADSLKVDPTLVREVMMEMRNGRRP